MSNKLIVIPTYNESENIVQLINQLSSTDCHILVVDDSSPDNTGKLVQSHKLFNKSLYLIERSENKGYAPSCIEGMKYGINNQYSNIIQMDADFSHSPEDLINMLSYSQNYDLVIGSRYVDGGATSGWGLGRILLSKIANLFANNYLKFSVKDSTSGFRIYKTEVLQKIDFTKFKSEGYGFLVQILFTLCKNKISIKEVPIHFNDRKFGTSKMDLSIIIEAIKLVIVLRLKS